ncbi:MAG: hypothetical protein IJ003_06630 [Candidatus Gastranaerophilales bacterium]|nr:hypothetical protein [Candidatus Gastranaerophilales bacterium]
MGWVSLSLRKQTLRAEINAKELRDIQLSREIRAIHRNLSYDQSVYNKDKKRELAAAKEGYLELRANKPERSDDPNDTAYSDWYLEYQDAQADYQEAKVEINEYYDDIMAEIEEEASEREAQLQEEQTQLEAQLEAMRAEFDSVKEQISADIQSSTPKFS